MVRLPAEVGAGDELGYSVGSVGDRVVVTSFKRRGKTEDSHPGSVFVFKDSGGKLELEAELVVPRSARTTRFLDTNAARRHRRPARLHGVTDDDA